ncbi:unnamed protein product [marine sediment metagenome]|uniref:Four helix bundle protein n=1 Tax=marine sediment metagenome TaxID=412755 RepID=X1KX44_9ZZZZ
MRSDELKSRTKKFAIDVIKLVGIFPNTKAADIIGRQLIKSSTSVGANYRSACRAQSRAHFISKLSIVLEETDESQYWLRLVLVLNLAKPSRIKTLINESGELMAIFISSIKTARKKT